MRSLFLLLLFPLCGVAQHGEKVTIPEAGKKPQWYQDAIIYSVDVKVFRDADGDGFGDFKGLIQKLGYISSLGVNTIWLAPFQPSPLQDDGYDITDYSAIDRRVGNKTDFLAFLDSCHRRKLRVIMDLVLDHSSDQHPWFVKSARSVNGYRNWYFWQSRRPLAADSGVAFPGIQKETWTYNAPARSFYYHRFYNFQPHLNFYEPAVRTAAAAILRNWLATGIDGFRVDAVPFMIEKPDPDKDTAYQLLTYIPEMRGIVNQAKPSAVLLGEANVPPDKVTSYSGKQGEGMQMLFNFFVNQFLFYALASGDVSPLRKALTETKLSVDGFQWVHFLRNHDEVDLGRLDSSQQKLAFRIFGPEKSMQLYNRGVRRRLAPMLGDSMRKIQLAYTVAASLPGAFMIRYGEEIGMGDDSALKERLAVRTPMQWNAEDEAGFTTSQKPIRPIISKQPYEFSKINVATESADSSSLLVFIRRLLRLRSAHPEIARGAWHLPDSSQSEVLAIDYQMENKGLLVVANFSSEEKTISLSSDKINAAALRGLFNSQDFVSVNEGSFRLTIPPEYCEWYEKITPTQMQKQ